MSPIKNFQKIFKNLEDGRLSNQAPSTGICLKEEPCKILNERVIAVGGGKF